MANLIEIKNATFSYSSDDERGQDAVSGLDLSIKEGKVTAILGKNGSGKSTLAKLCNGIIIPDSGSVFVDGMDTSDESKSFDIKKTVGMVFQNPDNQLVATICEEDVAFGPENLGVPSEEIRRRVDKALETVGMSEYAKREPHRLSGGQKQRIAIAGVLAMQPKCIIFDEATAMLDPYGRSEVLSTVKKLRESGITVVMITHYMEEALLADEIIVLSNGKVAASGTPLEIFSDEKMLSDAGLCPPQNIELTYILRKNGMNIPISTSAQKTAEDIYKALTGGISGN